MSSKLGARIVQVGVSWRETYPWECLQIRDTSPERVSWEAGLLSEQEDVRVGKCNLKSEKSVCGAGGGGGGSVSWG